MDKKDIQTEEDVRLLVDSFYHRVAEDELLRPVFEKRLGSDWSHHMPVMYRFWSTLLLGEVTYQGTPFLKHIDLGADKTHFSRWLDLFLDTADQLFSGPVIEDAKNRARSIAYIFQNKLGLNA